MKLGCGGTLALLAAILLSGSALSAEEASMRLTMEESEEIALRNNRTLAAARQESEKARGRIVEARAEALPGLSADITATHVGEPPQGTSSRQDNYYVTAALSQALYKGGLIRAGLRGASLFEEFSGEGVREAERGLIALVRKAYLDVLLQDELVSVQEQTLELASRNLDDVRLSKDAGRASRFDVIRAEVEVAQATASLTEAGSGLSVARKRFLNTLSLDLDTPFELVDDLRYSAVVIDEEGATEVALGNRPDLAQAMLSVEMQKEAISAARSPALPQVFATGTWQGGTVSQFDPGGTGSWQDGWQVGLSASLSLFDGMRTRGSVIQEKAALEQYRLISQDLKQSILLEVKEAVLNVRNAEELVRARQEEVKLAGESEQLARDRFSAGKATQLDILDAQLALSAARTGLATATYSHQLAVLEVERVTGTVDRPSLSEALLMPMAGEGEEEDAD